MHRGVFLVDGFIAGAWKLTRTKGEASLAVDVRARVRPAQRREVLGEAEALLVFLARDASTRRVELSPW